MKCFNCGRQIKENEEVYVHESGVYCSDCVKEETITQYILNGEILLGQDYVTKIKLSRNIM